MDRKGKERTGRERKEGRQGREEARKERRKERRKEGRRKGRKEGGTEGQGREGAEWSVKVRTGLVVSATASAVRQEYKCNRIKTIKNVLEKREWPAGHHLYKKTNRAGCTNHQAVALTTKQRLVALTTK